jgi:hypothetical protein
MIYLIIYLIGSVAYYLCCRGAFKALGEYTVSERVICFISSILSWLGAAAWGLVWLCVWAAENDKPAKW